MSVIQGTGTSIYLAAHMKEQARSMSIDPRKEDEKDPLIQSADAMGPGSSPQAPTFKEETP